jgi:hypothetical protein
MTKSKVVKTLRKSKHHTSVQHTPVHHTTTHHTHKNHSFHEGDNVWKEFKEHPEEYNVGDTITYTPNNQMGYAKYEVVLDDNGNKDLDEIDSYDKQMNDYSGGKKRKTKKSKKSKRSNKTKRSKKSKK